MMKLSYHRLRIYRRKTSGPAFNNFNDNLVIHQTCIKDNNSQMTYINQQRKFKLIKAVEYALNIMNNSCTKYKIIWKTAIANAFSWIWWTKPSIKIQELFNTSDRQLNDLKKYKNVHATNFDFVASTLRWEAIDVDHQNGSAKNEWPQKGIKNEWIMCIIFHKK